MTLFWLSCADVDGFRGVAIVEAQNLAGAVQKAKALGISPGGQVLGPSYPADAPGYDVAVANQNRLLSRADIDTLFPEIKMADTAEDPRVDQANLENACYPPGRS